MTTPIENKEGMSERTIAETAAIWDARLRVPNCTDAEREAFAAWRDANAEHHRMFERTQLVVRALRNEKDSALVRSLRDTERVIAAQRRRYFNYAMAASVVVAVTASVFWTHVHKFADLVGWANNTYVTGTGQKISVTLKDGSSLELNSKTRIAVAFSVAKRRVDLLEGQAFFRVAKDPHRPFRVHAGDHEILAVGTAFDVNVQKSAVRITLVEGKVVVSPDPVDRSAGVAVPRPIFLTAGQQLVSSRSPAEKTTTITRGKEPQLIRQIDTAKVTGWRDGRIFLQELTLADAVEEMNKYSTLQIEVVGSKLENKRVTGVFRAGEQHAFVNAIQSYFPVTAETQGDGKIVLKLR